MFMKKSFFFFLIFLMASLTLISCGHASRGALKNNVMNLTANGVSFKMIRVEGGTFKMGATSEQSSDADNDEKPAHQVTLSSFHIGETEVTQALWEAVMGSNPSGFMSANRPVEQVSWDDCQTFIRKLNAMTGKTFRLPTEAEWEYAARGGNRSMGYKYSGSNTMDEVGWYYENSGNSRLDDNYLAFDIFSSDRCTHPVKQKKANELGIYDMSGNVWEWTDSRYHFYDRERNAHIGKDAQMYIIRGGAWQLPKTSSRIAWRGKRLPESKNSFGGFRLCLDAKYMKKEKNESEILMKEKEENQQ